MKKIFMGMLLMVCGIIAGAKEVSNYGISDLRIQVNNGQLFLQWQEKDLPPNARLRVWSSEKPVTVENPGKEIARYLNSGSARDWWLDIDSFLLPRDKKLKDEEIFAGAVANEFDPRRPAQGFIIREGAKPIDPKGGLHVHTPGKGEKGKRYFAVTLHSGYDDKILQMISTDKAVELPEGKALPINISGKPMAKGCAGNKPLIVVLHGRGGGVGVDAKGNPQGTHLLFAPAELAWREGIPFKFEVKILADRVELIVYDRVWIGRRMKKSEISDSRDLVPAIATFWLGYNPEIARSIAGKEYKCDNYTERYLLYLIKWAQEFLGTDPAATYLHGGSMGGSGTVQMVTRYPEVFAAAVAYVPVYTYSWKRSNTGGYSAYRMQCSVGKFSEKNPARMPDGTDLLVFADGARNINRPAIDMPPLFATNGRKDGSIPWVNNPPFYTAANEARQAFTVFWNDGDHGMSGQRPEDMSFDFPEIFQLYRLDKSFPAFSNFSDNRNYGNGDFTDGDLTGWINRGLKWGNVVDSADRYEITVSASHPEIRYPATVDVTLRRRQKFLPAAGTEVKVLIDGKESMIKVDKNGLLTVEKVVLKDASPVHIILTK